MNLCEVVDCKVVRATMVNDRSTVAPGFRFTHPLAVMWPALVTRRGVGCLHGDLIGPSTVLACLPALAKIA